MGTSDRPPTTFKATLSDTDRLSYAAGDSILFNVVIENTGNVPLVLGTSRDPEVAPKTMSPCRVVPPGVRFNVALLALDKDRKDSRAFVATGFGFYGSPNVPGTTFVVQPGERVRVQLAAQIHTGPGFDPPLTAEPRPVRLQAFVMIERDRMVAEYSENTLEIELRSDRNVSEGWPAGRSSLEAIRPPSRPQAHAAPLRWTPSFAVARARCCGESQP